jgi:class 3 adenylate cyclase
VHYYINAVLFIPALFSIVYHFWNQNEKNEVFLFIEQNKSEKLILNILPGEIAAELKEHGYTKPKLYKEVSVLFTDFVGFTLIAEKLSPEELIDELDKCFSYFDSVTKRYNLEKLKTIGDAYMCAGGIPKDNFTHAIDSVLAAFEIQNFMNMMKELKKNQGHPYWELRLGINTGPLVAGVAGEMKFAYDIWGDTVNTASRMESAGIKGEINISKTTYDSIKYFFNCSYRGKVTAKNKGEIDMYFVTGIKQKFSVDNDGREPNDLFKEIYSKIKNGTKIKYKSEM